MLASNLGWLVQHPGLAAHAYAALTRQLDRVADKAPAGSITTDIVRGPLMRVLGGLLATVQNWGRK